MSASSSEESVEATCYARYEDLHLPDPSFGRYRAPSDLPILSQTI